MELLFAVSLTQKIEHIRDYIHEIHEKGWNADTALHLQSLIKELLHLTPSLDTQPLVPFTNKIKALSDGLLGAPEELDILQNVLKKLQEIIEINFITENTITEKSNTVRPLLILVLKDKKLTAEIVEQVKYFNYDCLTLDSLKAISEEVLPLAIKSSFVGALILDTEYCFETTSENSEITLQTLSKKLPLIFVSTQTNIATRLFAVQAGGKAFLTYPVEFTTFMETIDEIVIKPYENIPCRVLIIEDSRTQANALSKQLKAAGILTEILMEPLKINEILIEFQPDIILLDLYMPFCPGTDLAKVIRQQVPFTHIPILFLSAEADKHTQLNAIENGGDEFLTKPISAPTLIRIIKARVERYRKHHALMTQDGLTGLLNHTRLLEQLDLEIARAKRNHTTLSFAMIDLDYFKTVNDSHGHLAGDRVISGLARMLKQRLRKSDTIGRYGGEEFAIILPQTSSTAVYKILDDIRRGFAKLLHQSSDPLIEFTITFSGGLSEFNDKNNTVAKIVQTADQALYLAKEKGRNQIIKN